MPSIDQQIANQANAQHSTGPKTPEGKARSAINARTHGLCGKDLLIGPEQQPEFDQMVNGYYLELGPQGQVEQTLFDEVVGAAWQLRRVRRIETELCIGPVSYSALLDDEPLQKKLERLARHHTRIERTFHRCLKELKACVAERHRVAAECVRIAKFKALQLDRSSPISERTQSLPQPEAHLAGVDRVLAQMEANLTEQARKQLLEAA